MKQTPKVSVLMPVYNGQRYLARAIDSIIHQRFTEWELLIVDDGSTDHTQAIAQSYADSKIRFFANESNRGIVYTRHRLISESRGEYLAFLDSDDQAHPDRLRIQVDFLDKNKEYGFCGTWGKMIDDKQQVVKKINLPIPAHEIQCTLLFASTFVQSSILIRKQLMVANGYDTDYPLAEDYELWCRLLKIGKAKNIPQYLTLYRWHETNISVSKKQQLQQLVHNIHAREFNLLGLDATTQELVIHAAIGNKELYTGSNHIYFDDLKRWLKKLYCAAKNSNLYHTNTLQATICFRWIYACKERKAYLKMISMPIVINPISFSILCQMIYARIR